MRRGKDEGLSEIVRTLACIVSVPIAVFGFYIALHGHLTPGGGFAGGAVVATITSLLMVSFGQGIIRRLHITRFSLLRTIKNIGITIFGLLMVIASFSATFLHRHLTDTGWFFKVEIPFGANPGELGTGGIIPLINLAVGFEVVVGLSLAVVMLYVISAEGSDVSARKAVEEGFE
ncbi:MAG: sodium:proton antiporter [Candidatus Aenigmarchaeota archaeon]|nr:sodium:proton antiporter [Candidatus Aenigmarchaeota archaeon]